MCKANHTEEKNFFKRLFQKVTKASEETKEPKETKRVYYEGTRDLVKMGILPGSVKPTDEPAYIVRRFCLGLDESGSSVRLEWIPGKRIRLVKNRRDELDIEELPKMKLTHYKGEEKGLWEKLNDEQKREFATILSNVNAVIQIADVFSKEISADLLDKAYDYASVEFDPEEGDFPEAKIKVVAALRAAAATLKKAIEKIDDDDNDDDDTDTDTDALLRCHRPRSVVIEPGAVDDQEWIDDETVETPAEPAVETPAPVETPAEPTTETPAEPAVETPAPVETPAEPTTETPDEPATPETQAESNFDDTPDDPAEVKKSSKKKKRNK